MKVIPEFDRYLITQDGTVYSCVAGRGKKARNSGQPQRVIKLIQDTTGYLVVCLTNGTIKRNRAIHRLLAQAWIPNPNNLPHVNHIDGNKLNNALDNLEWVSVLGNTTHAIDMGMTDPKTRHPAMAEIAQLDSTGREIRVFMSLHDASRETGIAWQNISKVCRGLRKAAGGFGWVYK